MNLHIQRISGERAQVLRAKFDVATRLFYAIILLLAVLVLNFSLIQRQEKTVILTMMSIFGLT